MSGPYRCWRRDEFEGFESVEERDDRAWKVPDRRGVLFPQNSAPCDDPKDAAEQFADHCHARCDGWEWSWPQEFVVFDGEKYHLVEVSREMSPDFHAHSLGTFDAKQLESEEPDDDDDPEAVIGGEA